MSIALFFALALACACRSPRPVGGPPAARRVVAPSALETVSMGTFSYVGPGSMGRFPDFQRHPRLHDVLLAGADVGGVYLSTDDGASWTNVTRDLPTTGVWRVAISVLDSGGSGEFTRFILGTDSGLYTSNAIDSADGLSVDELSGWTEAEGLDRGEERADSKVAKALHPFHGEYRTLPVGALAVSPVDPLVVWAGITANGQANLAQNASDPFSLQRFDRWKLFRSLDGGLSFEPVLRFNAPVDAFVVTPFDAEGSVFTVLPHPTDAAKVWVATDRGLYYSENADVTSDTDGNGIDDLIWTELGTAARRSTTDGGMSWTDAEAVCVDPEDDPAAGGWCLPISSNAHVRHTFDESTGRLRTGTETHPNLRGMAISTVEGQEQLFLTVWDRGHANDEPDDCSLLERGDSFDDVGLEYFRGGVYRSIDGGETWSWLFTDTGLPGGTEGTTVLFDEATYRCDKRTSERNSSNDLSLFPDVQAPATWSGEGPLLVVAGLGPPKGLLTYDPTAESPWTWHTNRSAGGWSARFEGGQAQNLSGQGGVEASRVLVDWESVAEGYPDVLFNHRGILRASWDSSDDRYEFVHLGSDYGGEIDDMHHWTGTGLDDCAFWDVQPVDDQTMWLGVADGGVFRASLIDGKWYYANVATAYWTPNWSDSTSEMPQDEAHALALDEGTGTVYAGAFVTSNSTQYTVFAGQDTSWTVIGGFGYTSDESLSEEVGYETYNGFYSGSPLHTIKTNELLWISDDAGPSFELLAATSDGLWTWDAEGTAGSQWSQLCTEHTDVMNISDVVFDPTLVPDHAFAVMNGARGGGLLDIDLSTSTCETIEVYDYIDTDGTEVVGTDPIRAPTALTLAGTAGGEVRLVVGGSFNGYAAILSASPICAESCTVETWNVAWTGAGLYEAGSHRDELMGKLDVESLEVWPGNKQVILGSFGSSPIYDQYNPQYMIASEDAGQSWETIDFEADDHGLPKRATRLLEFSAAGDRLYAASSASLWVMDVDW